MGSPSSVLVVSRVDEVLLIMGGGAYSTFRVYFWLPAIGGFGAL